MNKPDKPEQDEVLKQYLTGQDRVSATYAAQERAQPSAQLDAAIMQAAQAALPDSAGTPSGKAQVVSGSRTAGRSYLPVAASIMLGILVGSWYLTQAPMTSVMQTGFQGEPELESAPVIQSAERITVQSASVSDTSEAMLQAPVVQQKVVEPGALLAPAAARQASVSQNQGALDVVSENAFQEPEIAADSELRPKRAATFETGTTVVNLESGDAVSGGAPAGLTTAAGQTILLNTAVSDNPDDASAELDTWLARIRALTVELAARTEPDATLDAALAEEQRLFRLAWPDVDLDAALAGQD